jgi:hypothetical protein
MNRLTEKNDRPYSTDIYDIKINEYDYKNYSTGTSIGACLDKLGKLEDLEEEIGCPLEVVVKALKNGFKFKISSHKLGTKQETVEQIIYCDYAYLYYADDVKAWCISTINDYFYLKDYQKTWFLKKDKSE